MGHDHCRATGSVAETITLHLRTEISRRVAQHRDTGRVVVARHESIEIFATRTIVTTSEGPVAIDPAAGGDT